MKDSEHGVIVGILAAMVVALGITAAVWATPRHPPEPATPCTGGAYYLGYNGGGNTHDCETGTHPATPPIENWNGNYYLVCVCPEAAPDASAGGKEASR